MNISASILACIIILSSLALIFHPKFNEPNEVEDSIFQSKLRNTENKNRTNTNITNKNTTLTNKFIRALQEQPTLASVTTSDDTIDSAQQKYNSYIHIFDGTMRGQWNSQSSQYSSQDMFSTETLQTQLGVISGLNGRISIKFNDLLFSDNKMMYISMFQDHEYEDQLKLLIKIPLDISQSDNHSPRPTISMIYTLNDNQQVDKVDVEAMFLWYLYDRVTGQVISTEDLPYSDPINEDTLSMHLSIATLNHSQPVSFSAELDLDTTDYFARHLAFASFAGASTLISILSSSYLFNHLKNHESDAKHLSLLSAGICTVQDAYYCLVFLWQALSMSKYFALYALPALLYFLLSTVFEMRLTVILWKEQHYRHYRSINELKQGIATFYSIFYLGLFSYFISMSFLYTNNAFLLLTSLVILPQILKTTIKGNTRKFFGSFIFGVLLPRAFLPLYMRGCPDNLLGYKPSTVFAVIWVGSFVVQILITILQSKFGPRFLIPSPFLPKIYDYTFVYEFNPAEQESSEDCAICLGPLYLDPLEDVEENLDSAEGLKKNLICKKVIQKTPCNHLFHQECLRAWAEVKQECPQCRAALPILN